MRPRLSYIIPVYNASDSINECLESLFLLPLEEKDFEVIVVDDCSTDNTCLLLHQYASIHPNLVVLHQETNQRQGAARNRGIEIAKGEYISFCDADDQIATEGVINALNAVQQTGADVCYFDFLYEHPQGIWNSFQMPEKTHNTILSSIEYLENYYTCSYNAPWRCLYRSCFLRKTGLRFEEGIRWEDCDWTVKVLAQANAIQFVDGVGYRYFYNALSTSHLRSVQAMSERVYAGLRLMDYGEEVKNAMPRLSKVLRDEGRFFYVMDTIRLRNLTKYTFNEIRDLYTSIGEERIQSLSKYSWPNWESLFLKHKMISLFIIFFACPIAAWGRRIVSCIRDLSKQ